MSWAALVLLVWVSEECVATFLPRVYSKLALISAGEWRFVLTPGARQQLAVPVDDGGYREAGGDRIDLAKIPGASALTVPDCVVVDDVGGYVLRLRHRWGGPKSGRAIVRLRVATVGQEIETRARFVPVGGFTLTVMLAFTTVLGLEGVRDTFWVFQIGLLLGLVWSWVAQRGRATEAAQAATEAIERKLRAAP